MAITQYRFSPSQNSRISEYTHTFNMTPRYLRVQLPGSHRGDRLKAAIATPAGTTSSVLCFQSSPKLFSEPLLHVYKLHLPSSYSKNTTSSTNSLTILKKNSPSNTNVKSRGFFNIQWNTLMPNILGWPKNSLFWYAKKQHLDMSTSHVSSLFCSASYALLLIWKII